MTDENLFPLTEAWYEITQGYTGGDRPTVWVNMPNEAFVLVPTSYDGTASSRWPSGDVDAELRIGGVKFRRPLNELKALICALNEQCDVLITEWPIEPKETAT